MLDRIVGPALGCHARVVAVQGTHEPGGISGLPVKRHGVVGGNTHLTGFRHNHYDPPK